MRLLDTYATNTGSTIEKPFIFEKIFPLPFEEKYITLQSQTPYDSRNYEYWQDVINIINPFLIKNNIKIVHTGLKDDKKYYNVVDLLGQTNINQLAFIIKNTLLHFGSDSFGVHLASYYNKPIVALYSISNPNVAGPHFGDKDKQVLIKAYEKIGNKKPSYSANESPKSINFVKPEEIAKSILKLLNIESNFTYETIFTGSRYTNKIIEIFPDQILPPNLFNNNLVNIRLDYVQNIDNNIYNAILNNLNIRPCALVTDKEINLQPFLNFKEKFNIFYNITHGTNINFINEAKKYGFKIHFIFELHNSNEFTLNKRKLELINYNQIIEVVKQETIIEEDLLNKDNLIYKTNKLLIANNQMYLSKSAQEENKPFLDINSPWEQPLKDIININKFIMNDLVYTSIVKI